MGLPGIGLLRWQGNILRHHYAHDRQKMYFSSILASILIGFALLLLVFPISLMVFVPDLFDAQAHAVFLPIEFVLMLFCLGAYVLLMKGAYNAGRNIFVAASIVVTLASTYLTGGFPDSIVTPCLILLPVIVHLLYGHKIGWIFAAVLLVVVGLQWAIVSNWGIVLPDYTSKTSPDTSVAMVFLVAFGAIQSAIALYQRQNQKLNEELLTERKNLEYLANHDSLTGLFNPRVFYEQLDAHEQDASKSGEGFAVVYMDLDDFKQVNDNHGHMVGDRVVKIIAERLEACIGDDDIVARMGGDEFAILVASNINDASLLNLRGRLQQAVCEAIVTENISCTVGISIGYALYPVDAQNSQALLQKADQDMYRDKSLKTSRHCPEDAQKGLSVENRKSHAA